MSAIDSFWFIPTIQDAIALHLSQKDLCNCINASRDLRSAFTPLLWRNINSLYPRTVPVLLNSPSALIYRHHVRFLSFKLSHIEAMLQHTYTYGSFPNLVRLYFEVDNTLQEDQDFDFLTFAALHTSTLKNLRMTQVDRSKKFLVAFGAFMDMMALEHGPLNKLALVLEDGFGSLDVDFLLSKCVSLEKLVFLCGEVVEDSLVHHSDVVFRQSDIKRLTFVPSQSVDSVAMEDHLTRLLEYCPRLEKLDLWVGMQIRDRMGRFRSVIQSRCLALNELVMDTTNVDSDVLFQLLRCCPRLRKLSPSLRIRNDQVVLAILSRHGETLEELDFSNGSEISKEAFNAIATSCPRLRKLCVQVNWKDDSLRIEDVWPDLLESESGSTWVCTGLEYLSLGFLSQEPTNSAFGCTEKIEEIYSELRRLTRLQELRISLDDILQDFRSQFVSCVWGGRFSGWKNLRGLGIPEHEWFLQREEALAAMVRQLPRLQYFYCIGQYGEWERAGQKEIFEMRERLAR